MILTLAGLIIGAATAFGATQRRAPQERKNAYELACKELDGLVVSPFTTRAGIERGSCGQIEQ